MPREPMIEDRQEQRYVGIRAVMPMRDFSREIPAMTEKVAGWLKAKGVQPSGKPFLRYHVVDMPERLDVELGMPVDGAPDVDGDVRAGALPAGRYAVLTYQGVKNGVPSNKKLIEWTAARGEDVVSHESENGEAFKARYETFLTDAKAEPDQDKWETEVAMKLRD